MPNIQFRTESKRGCGWKAEGGSYLVCEGKWVECGFLPQDVPDNINVTRGPQWRNAGEVLNFRKKCEGKCKGCWIKNMDPNKQTLLKWVGTKNYSMGQFINEAKKLGISQRISQALAFKIAKSGGIQKLPIILAHREASKTLNENEELEMIRQVFRIFTPTRIEYVAHEHIFKMDKRTTEYKNYMAQLNMMEKMGITIVRIKRAGKNLDLFDNMN
jgi:hypothetical protein